MSDKWKWSFAEAFSVIRTTYWGDWGGARRQHSELLKNTNISEVKQGSVTGLQSGAGCPVIFIHGSPGNAMRWEWFLKNPPKGYHVIAIDRMGFGQRGKEKPDLEVDFKVLLSFISQFKNPIIVGHSLGGAMVARLACHCDVGGVVFVASSIDPALERILPIQKIANSLFVKWVLSRSVRHSNEEMLQLCDFMMRTESHLGKVTAPVHVVHARDDYLVPFANVEYAKKYFQICDVTVIEEGRHGLPWTHPEVVVNAIESVRKSS